MIEYGWECPKCCHVWSPKVLNCDNCAPADNTVGRDDRQELSCTGAGTERAWTPNRRAPASAFGFALA